MRKINSLDLLRLLKEMNLENAHGRIQFKMANVTVTINTTDTVGVTLQAWLKQFFIDNDIFFKEPVNTQEFPDFFLDNCNEEAHMLEVKAFNYPRSPAFDIANFESYCDSVKEKVWRLNADYLIFGYEMSENGDISIKDIWLKKIWQISGTSTLYPLKTQIKRGMIYNIRPNSDFKYDRNGPFSNEIEFLKAMYKTLSLYKGETVANNWKTELTRNYFSYFHQNLCF